MLNNKFLISEIKDKKEILDSLVANKLFLFGPTDKESVWNWLENLQLDLSRLDLEVADFEVETAYKFNLLVYLNFEQISLIDEKILALKNLLSLPRVGELTVTNKHQEISSILENLEMDPGNKLDFYEKLTGLTLEQLDQVSTLLKEVFLASVAIKPDLQIFSALLLYALPEDIPANFKDFKARFLILADNFELSEAVAVFRFLGQGFFGYDYELLNWIFEYYANQDVGLEFHNSQTDNFFDQFVIYLLFKNFLNLEESQRYFIIDHLILSALIAYVPLEVILKDYLATSDLLPDYILNSSALADILLLSEQSFVFGNKEEKVEVGKFISDYLSFAKNEDFKEEKQREYLSNFKQRAELTDFEYNILFQLLNIYLHLRECDLLDYRGYLSEGGVKEMFDWATFFAGEVDEQKLAELRRYFKYINRPVYLKVKILSYLQDVNWREEPLFSKVLLVNELYESVFGPRFGYLVYYFEDKGEFVLNLDLPDLSADFLNLASGKKIDIKDQIIFPEKK